MRKRIGLVRIGNWKGLTTIEFFRRENDGHYVGKFRHSYMPNRISLDRLDHTLNRAVYRGKAETRIYSFEDALSIEVSIK